MKLGSLLFMNHPVWLELLTGLLPWAPTFRNYCVGGLSFPPSLPSFSPQAPSSFARPFVFPSYPFSHFFSDALNPAGGLGERYKLP